MAAIEKMEKMMSNPATVVGAQTHIKGNLEGDEDLTVIGRVDGNISLTKTLTVDPSGVVVADIQVNRAIISGVVVGNVTAAELVHITEEGRVVGDLAAPRVVLVDGATFKGNVEMGDMDAPQAAAPTRPRTSARPAPEPPKAAPRPAPPPKRVVPQSKATTRKPGPRRVAPPEPAEPLQERAEAAARAVAQAAKDKKAPPKKAPEKKGAPKPPTTAGKKTRARRR